MSIEENEVGSNTEEKSVQVIEASDKVSEEKSEQIAEGKDTVDKLHELQKRFYAVCGELFKYAEFVGEPMYNLMLEHYFAQYKREYELMNAEEFIEVDKMIEELKIERDKELEAVKLERDRQRLELLILRDKTLEEIKLERDKLSEELAIVRDREYEAVKLEHTELMAEIARKKEKLNNEIEILAETALLEAQIKTDRIIPQCWRRFHIGRLHFGKICKNEAMQYAEESAGIEISQYLAMREQAILQSLGTGETLEDESEENTTEGTEAEIEAVEPRQMTKREYAKWLKRFEKELRTRKEEALNAVEEIMREPAESETVEQSEERAGRIETSEEGGEPDASA